MPQVSVECSVACVDGTRDVTCLGSEDGVVALGFNDGSLRVWFPGHGALRGCVPSLRGESVGIAVSNGTRVEAVAVSRHLLAASSLEAYYWRLDTLLTDPEAAPHTVDVRGISELEGAKAEKLAVNSDSTRIAVSYGRNVLVWDVEADAAVALLEGHTAGLQQLYFTDSADGKGEVLITTSDDRSYKVWDYDGGALLYQSAIVSAHAVLCVADTRQGGEEGTTEHGPAPVRKLAFGLADGTVRIVSPEEGYKEVFSIDLSARHQKWRAAVAASQAKAAPRLKVITAPSTPGVPLPASGAGEGAGGGMAPEIDSAQAVLSIRFVAPRWFVVGTTRQIVVIDSHSYAHVFTVSPPAEALVTSACTFTSQPPAAALLPAAYTVTYSAFTRQVHLVQTLLDTDSTNGVDSSETGRQHPPPPPPPLQRRGSDAPRLCEEDGPNADGAPSVAREAFGAGGEPWGNRAGASVFMTEPLPGAFTAPIQLASGVVKTAVVGESEAAATARAAAKGKAGRGAQPIVFHAKVKSSGYAEQPWSVRRAVKDRAKAKRQAAKPSPPPKAPQRGGGWGCCEDVSGPSPPGAGGENGHFRHRDAAGPSESGEEEAPERSRRPRCDLPASEQADAADSDGSSRAEGPADAALNATAGRALQQQQQQQQQQDGYLGTPFQQQLKQQLQQDDSGTPFQQDGNSDTPFQQELQQQLRHRTSDTPFQQQQPQRGNPGTPFQLQQQPRHGASGAQQQQLRRTSSRLRRAMQAQRAPVGGGVPCVLQQQHLATLRGRPVHAGAIVGLAFSTDARHLACASSDRSASFLKVPVAKHNGEAHIFKAHTAPVTSVGVTYAFGDQQSLVTGSLDGTAKVWKAGWETPFLSIKKPGDVAAARFFGIDRLLVLAVGGRIDFHKYLLDRQKEMRELDRAANYSTERQVETVATGCQSVLCLACHNAFHSPIVFFGGSSRVVAAYDVVKGRAVVSLESPHAKPVHHITIPSSGTARSGSLASNTFELFCTSSCDGTIKLWDLRCPATPVRAYSSHVNRVHSVGASFSPCMRYLATGSEDRAAYVYELSTGRLLTKNQSHSDVVSDVAFNPVHPQLASCSFDGQLHFWADK
ncbi:putative WD repeat-containing protein [Diplonema papillatum]|nr:putative WD repeat-containing protein [Diplonema papillatum]